MRTRTAAVLAAATALALSLLSGTVHAQATTTAPGLVVAIQPCAIAYSTFLPANTPVHFEVREYCGVPTEASAVFLNMKVGGSATAGKIYVWPYDGTGATPQYSQFNYTPNYAPGEPHSDQVLVRLRPVHVEEEPDLSVKATTSVNFSVVVEGYVIPAA